MLVNHRHRRLLASSHAWRGNHVDVVCTQRCFELSQQSRCASHVTTEAIAHAQGETRRFLSFANDFKVVIKSSHLIHFRHGQVHEFGQGHQVALVQPSKFVVDFVKMLYEQIAALLQDFVIHLQQGKHFTQRSIICLTPFELALLTDLHAHVFDTGKSDHMR